MKHTYLAFYNDREIIVEATSSYAAQQEAVKIFSPPKSKKHMVHVMLNSEYVKENYRYS